MTGLDYVINLIDKSFSGGMKNAKKNTEGLDNAVQKTNRHTRGLEKSSKKGFGGIVKWAKRAAIATGLVFAIGQVSAFGNEVTNVAAKYEGYSNAIKFASGTEGGKNIAFLNQKIKDLNLDMGASYEGFQTLTGSLKGTSLEGKGTRDIFEAVGIAATTMNLTADQSKGAFLAIGQMASKGKVQAEELRGQLGERIPGALNIAARAMGVNQVEFNKMLDTGKVYAEDFLPKFAKELKKTFQGGLPAAANSMQAAINKKNNALVSFKKSFGDNMKPAIMGILSLKTKFFSFLTDIIPKLKPIWTSIKKLAYAFKPIIDRIKSVMTTAGGATGIIGGLSSVIDGLSVYVEIAAEGLGFLWDIISPLAPMLEVIAIAWGVWNIAIWAGTAPITAIVLGIGLLAGGLIYAYKKIGWFRGGLMEAWETIKGFGTMIKTFVIDRIKQMISGITGIGATLMHFFKGDRKKAWETGKESVKNLTGIGVGNFDKLKAGAKATGLATAKAYVKGVEEADANSKNSFSFFDSIKSPTKAPTSGGGEKGKPKVPGKNDAKKLRASVGGGAGGGGKNITFKIESLVKQLTIQPQTLKEGVVDVEKQVKDMFIRLIRDVELQTN